MPRRPTPVKVTRPRRRTSAIRGRATLAPKRATGPTAARQRRRRELERLREQVHKLSSDLRRARRELRQARANVNRLRSIEAEVEALRHELGPQRPLLLLPDLPAPPAREPWMPPAVEAHLTALHDHDVAALEALLAPDITVTEAPFPHASRCGWAEVAAWHADLFAAWTDFRFMPRHWHNIGGAAFLEGEASCIQRGERHGIHANGKLVTLDMLLVYHLSDPGIRRIKLYYDAATLRRQVTGPGVQTELF